VQTASGPKEKSVTVTKNSFHNDARSCRKQMTQQPRAMSASCISARRS
jgi:hypothetical protein